MQDGALNRSRSQKQQMKNRRGAGTVRYTPPVAVLAGVRRGKWKGWKYRVSSSGVMSMWHQYCAVFVPEQPAMMVSDLCPLLNSVNCADRGAMISKERTSGWTRKTRQLTITLRGVWYGRSILAARKATRCCEATPFGSGFSGSALEFANNARLIRAHRLLWLATGLAVRNAGMQRRINARGPQR